MRLSDSPAERFISQLAARPTKDPGAKQALLSALRQANDGATTSGALLKAAADANIKFARTQSNVDLARRAVLAKAAYRARTSAEVARYRATYAMLAEQAGTEATTAAELANTAQDANQKRVFVEKSRAANARRNVLMDAAAATEKALKAIPPLPEAIEQGAPESADASPVIQVAQSSLGWRPPEYVKRASAFFPAPVRRAAGALGDVNPTPAPANEWWQSLLRVVGQGVSAAGQAAQREGQAVANTDARTAAGLSTASGWLTFVGGLLGGGQAAGATGSGPVVVQEQGSPLTDYIIPVAAGLGILGLIALLRR